MLALKLYVSWKNSSRFCPDIAVSLGHSLLSSFSLALPSCLAPFQLAPGLPFHAQQCGWEYIHLMHLIITQTSPVSGHLPAFSSQGSTSRSHSLTKSIATAFSTLFFWPMMRYIYFFTTRVRGWRDTEQVPHPWKFKAKLDEALRNLF